jgi:hypothetical protein
VVERASPAGSAVVAALVLVVSEFGVFVAVDDLL